MRERMVLLEQYEMKEGNELIIIKNIIYHYEIKS